MLRRGNNAVCPNEVDTPMLRTGFAMRGFDPGSAVAELAEPCRLAGSRFPMTSPMWCCFLPGRGAYVRRVCRGEWRRRHHDPFQARWRLSPAGGAARRAIGIGFGMKARMFTLWRAPTCIMTTSSPTLPIPRLRFVRWRRLSRRPTAGHSGEQCRRMRQQAWRRCSFPTGPTLWRSI